MAEWFSQIPHLVLFLLILIIPGWLTLYVVGFRGLLSVAAAPPISLGIVAATGIAARILRVSWSMAVLAAGVLIVVATAWFVGRIILGKLPPLPPKKVVQRPRFTSLIAIATAIVVAVVSTSPILTVIDPTLPQQQIDSVFHLNVAWSITQTGDASLFSAASTNYGLRAIPTYYPVVWHAIVALVGGPEGVVAASNSLVVVCFGVWVLGIAGLALEAFPRSRWAPPFGVAATLLFPVFPTYMAIYRQLWPNLLGYSVVPAAISLVLRALRLLQARTETGLRRSLVAGLSAMLAMLGAVATYPSVFFGLLLLMAPLAINLVIEIRRWIGRRYGSHARHFATAVLVVGIVLGPIAVVLWRPSTVAFFTRPSYATFENLVSKAKALVSMWPQQNGMPFILIAVSIIVAATIAGIVVVVKNSEQRWIAWAWALPMLVTLACYLPLGPITSLTGLWYNDPNRVLPLALPSVCLFVGALVNTLEKRVTDRTCSELRIKSRLRMVLAVFGAVVVAAGSTWSARMAVAVQPYAKGSSQLVDFADKKELEFIESLRGKLRPGLMVLGEPTTGAPYFQALGNQKVAFPHITYRHIDTDGSVLAQHFSDIHTDPRICQIVLHYRIGYFYSDDPGVVPDVDPQKRSPGFFGVDTSRGFELLGESGKAKLYKITACGPVIPGRNFWDLSRRWEPLYDHNGERNSFWRDGKVQAPGEEARLWQDSP